MFSTHAEPKKIKHLNKITDTSLAALPPVIMGNFAVVTCKEEDNVYLYTGALGPCVSIAARCKDRNGNVILGSLHMVGIFEDQDFLPGTSNIRELVLSLRKVLKPADQDRILAKLQPYLLTNMLEKMRMIVGDDPIIDVYMGGGRGGQLADSFYTILTEFIKRRSDLKLVDTAFNPYQFTKDEAECGLTGKVYDHLETIFGITSKGEVLSTTPININIDQFNSDESVLQYLAKQGVSLPLKNMISGFDFDTYLKTSANAREFTVARIETIFGQLVDGDLSADKQKAATFAKSVIAEGSSPVYQSDKRKSSSTLEDISVSKNSQGKGG